MVFFNLMKIWIDLDNSPHVPFFAPIIDELVRQQYSLLVTARDCFQVCDLARILNIPCRAIGRHFGKNPLLKVAGLAARTLQLAPVVLREKPQLAISHGSRAQLTTATLLGVPSIVMIDYEFAQGLTLLRPSWVMVPDVIPTSGIPMPDSRIVSYPGIKEDVYVPFFQPDPGIRAELGIGESDLVVTLRPPATEAHYHVPESDQLYRATMNLLTQTSGVKVILLPRNGKQGAEAKRSWPAAFASGSVVIPEMAVDGLNLIWHSDLVISGGGTMNREAAALGVPVYSIFRGKLGSVDSYLAKTGRLVLIENEVEVSTKMVLKKRSRTAATKCANSPALHAIVSHINNVLDTRNPIPELNPR